MSHFTFYTASSLDGYLADSEDNLDWLTSQPMDEDGVLNYGEFIADVGALVMGATTYQWVLDHNETSGEKWSYTQPTWVFTHRELPLAADNVTIVAGAPEDHRQTLLDAAGGKSVWVVGGGDLAAQFADAGLLDDIIVCYAPVTLGAGRPLFTRAYDLELTEFGRNKAFLCARYRFVGPRGASAAE